MDERVNASTVHAMTDSFFELVKKVHEDIGKCVEMYDSGHKGEALDEAANIMNAMFMIASDPVFMVGMKYLFEPYRGENKSDEKFDPGTPVQ